MTTRIVLSGLLASVLASGSAFGQIGDTPADRDRYIDAATGMSLDQAITRALEQEPSLRAARSQVDIAAAARAQAALRPNPSVSFERRDEPGGTDNQTMIGVEWRLDLFRRDRRIVVADRHLTTARSAVDDRVRLLASEVRSRYGEALAAARDLAILDEIVALVRQQHALLQSRVDEGASPPLERDLLDVELRRLESERALQAGRTEAAMVDLKRVLGMTPGMPLTLRDTLEDLVRREASAPASTPQTTTDLDARADVREAAARIATAEARIAHARADGRFDVSVFASYMRMDAGFPQRAVAADGSLARIRGLFHYVSAGAMVTVPLLNRNQGEVAAARAERAGAAAAYEAVRLSAETEVAAARAREAHALQAVGIYGDRLQALARHNLSVVAQSYALGGVTVFEVLAEQRRYQDLERAYTGALHAAYEARTARLRALGDVR